MPYKKLLPTKKELERYFKLRKQGLSPKHAKELAISAYKRKRKKQ